MRQHRIPWTCDTQACLRIKQLPMHTACLCMFLTKFWGHICRSLRAYCLSSKDLLAVWTGRERILCLYLSHLFLWEAIGSRSREKMMPLCRHSSFSQKAQTWSAAGQETWENSLHLGGVFEQPCVLEATWGSDCS